MNVTITIEGEGLSLKKETSLQKAGQIIAFLGLEDNSTNLGPSQTPNPPPAFGLNSTSSLKNMLVESKAKTNAQKITVIGLYLSDTDKKEDFLVKEVLLQLKKMGDEPGNFTRDLNSAESLKYITPLDDSKNIYCVTERGKEAIQSQFSNETRAKSTKRGGFKKSIPPKEEVISMPIVTTMDGYPNFYSMSTKADSILWVLAYAENNSVNELNAKEVEILTDKLRNKIPQNTFSPHNKRNIKEGYVAQTDGRFKLQQKGIDYLKKITPQTHETH